MEVQIYRATFVIGSCPSHLRATLERLELFASVLPLHFYVGLCGGGRYWQVSVRSRVPVGPPSPDEGAD